MSHLILLLSIFTLILTPKATSVSFKFQQFSRESKGMIYEGDATPVSGVIELNSQLNKYMCHIGRAIYAEKVRIWDSSTQALADFDTHFTFTIDTLGAPTYGHGIAFFLTPVGFQIPLNSGGGFFGLYNFTTTRNEIVHVEFDSKQDPWDPRGLYGHVGININSLSSAKAAPWNVSLHSGEAADVWITYNAATKNLSVVWVYQTGENSGLKSSLSYNVDLRKALPEWVIIGFTASVGSYVERNQVNSWEFSSSLNSRMQAKARKIKIELIAGILAPIIILVIGTVISWRAYKSRKHKNRVNRGAKTLSIMTNFQRGGPRRFSYRELASATSNFSPERKVGEGGFGEVYRGHLEDLNVAIAVKKIRKESRQGKNEYITEVRIISQLRHQNLVQLLGWCHDEGEFILVYEFMPYGSLDSHLFSNRNPLPWTVRYKTTLGLASALMYLHEEWEQCIVHRDIKASNVMLDCNYNAKLGDFGLARLMDHHLSHRTTGLAGTFGYMAPEYIATGKASKESDVHSFGVVVLEIASGRKSIDPVQENSDTKLIEWLWNLHCKGDLLSAVDKKLQNNYDFKQAEILLSAGLWCVQTDPSSRPSIRQVVQVLHFDDVMPNLPLKRPYTIFDARAAVDSANYATIRTSYLSGS